MHDGTSHKEWTVFTIGHSNHPPETFIDLLRKHRIDVVADARSSPYTRYAVHFNKDSLEALIKANGIRYIFMGDAIGGRPAEREFYDADGYVLYDRLAKSARFKSGIERLMQGIRSCRLAVLCSEEDPAGCHRRLLIGRVLGECGVEVCHIRGDGSVQTEAELARAEKRRVTKGQMSLFDTQERPAWKSTQSVLPGKAEPNSSSS